MNYLVYILRCADDTLYTGITTDMDRRLQEHNSSQKGAKYTQTRRPVSLVYTEETVDRSAALKREYALRNYSRTQKLALIKDYAGQSGTKDNE